MILIFLPFIKSLIEASKDSSAIANEKNVLAVALFDHEEVGSESAHGAARYFFHTSTLN